ncbi:MAG: Ig-like domain repeat protein [Acidobacteria bacterium]|nr:Ig-like domain repeat protein [Acidobacteriota bacterium]
MVITNNGSLTIQGPGASVVTVSGNNTSNVFKIASGTVTIDGIKVATGRIGIWNLGTLNLINSIVSGNTTVGIFNTGTMTITDSTISGNSNSTTYGIAGIYTTATMTITGSTISNNSATNFQSDGGGIGLYGGFLTITRSIITGNSGEYAGGIQLYGGSGVLITDTTISGNTARQGGGGISKWYSSNSVPISIVNSTISGNTAGSGAGINTWASPVTITNSTISNNSASYKGGGIYMVDSSTQLKVTNSTITGNRANTGNLGGDGGGIYAEPALPIPNSTLNSTIVAGNLIGTGTTPNDLSGHPITSAANSLIGDSATSGGIVNGVGGNKVGFAVSSILNTTLANNGGPTQTHALVANSPAIDAGSNTVPTPLDFDQRGTGFPRIINDPSIANVADGTDIGAFEFEDATPPTVTSIDDGDADDSIGINTMLTYTVTFSEDIDGATVTAGDFNNAGTAMVTIGTVIEGTPGVVSVQVTPTTAGTIILRIPTGSVISDLAGNNLVVPVQDNETVNVLAETTAVVDAGNLVITDANGGTSNDNITISCTTAPPPTMVVISDPGNSLNQSFELSSITGNITVNTLGGNDSLTLDLAGCNFTANGVTFNGGDPTSAPGDKLIILGGSTTTQTFNFTNEHDGSVVLAGGARSGTINYTGLEPVSSTVTAANVVLNYSTITETITVSQDAGTPAQTLVDSNVGGESVSFVNPTTSLQINGGDTGDDTINVNGFGTSGGGFTASLTINGGTGNDTVSLNADINFAAGNNLDVNLQNDNAPNPAGTDTINVGPNANLILTGTGAATLAASRNIAMASGSSITTVNGNLTLNANQQATPTPGYFYAVDLQNATLTTSGRGNIVINGKGGSDTVAAPGVFSSLGLFVNGTGSIRSTSSAADAGLITIDGRGGNTGATGTVGVLIAGQATIASVSGDISLDAVGGETIGVDGVISSYGLGLSGSTNSITSTGVVPSAASITITATGGNVTSSQAGSYGLFNGGSISTVDGPISVTGVGGNTTGVGTSGNLISVGVMIFGTGTIASSGTGANAGSMTLLGTSGNTNVGAAQAFRQDGALSTVDGDISITGTSSTCVDGCFGSHIRANISATGDGNVTITGTGGTATAAVPAFPTSGVIVRNGATVSTATGSIEVIGTGGNTTNNAGFQLGGLLGTAGTLATTGGSVTVNADTIFIDTALGTITAPGRPVSLRQKTNDVAINLGSAIDTTPSTLELSDAELDRITAGTLNIGNSSSGTITTSADITRPAATNVNLVTAGDVLISGGQIDTGGGTLLLDPGVSPFAVKPTKSLTDVTASTLSFGSDLAIVINGTTVDTQYTQLNVVGAVNLTGVSLVLSGTHVPTAGQQFTIVNNDGGDLIVGTFNGLAQGAAISNFLGAPGVNATISYTGGTGNDVVLTVDNVPPTVTSTTPLQGAINVDRNGNITLNFSEPVNILAGGITVNCGGAEAFSPTLPQNGVTSIVIDPGNTLPAGVLCTVTGVSASIADPAGNQLDGDSNGSAGPNFTLTFTTACTTNPIVTTNADSGAGSLRQAVIDACPGNTITFQAGVSPVTLTTGQIVINKNLTIDGGTGATVTRSAVAPNFRIFQVNGGTTVELRRLTISNGNEANGGGISSNGTLTLRNSTVSGNTASGFGGGLFSFGALTITDSTFSGNQAGNAGGFFQGNASLNMSGSTVSGNTTTFQAAGLNIQDANATITNSTISGNVSQNSNGGIANISSTATVHSLNLINTTITGNTSVGIYGAVWVNEDAASPSVITSLRNTLVGGNTGRNFSTTTQDVNVVPLPNSMIVSDGYNLDSDGTSGFVNGANGDIVGSLGLPINAQLASLANNGGTTQTHALLNGSPAINAGNDCVLTANGCGANDPVVGLTTDQRGAGFARKVGSHVDIGAFELPNTPPTITPTAGVTRQRGSALTNSVIANVGDIETPLGSLGVTVNGGATATDGLVTLSNIAVSAAGVVTADIVANCLAVPGNFTLTVTDGGGLSTNTNLTVLVTANTPPAVTFNGPQNVVFGQSGFSVPTATATDNGSITGYVLQSVVPAMTVTPKVNPANGTVTINNAGPTGSHVITVRSTDNCGAVTDSSFTLVVNRAGTTTTIFSDTPDPSVVGQNYTVTIAVAPVAPGAGVPTGNITISDGTNTCVAILPATSCQLASTSAGPKTLTAAYSGDTNFNGSTAATAPHQVDPAQTATTVQTLINAPNYGSTLTATATITAVAPGSGTPQGTVNFNDGGNPIAGCQNVAVTALGSAVCTTNQLPAGVGKVIQAVYSGNANYLTSNGSTTQTIGKAPLNVAASSAAVTYGDAAPAITAAITGFVLGETTANLTTQPTCSTTYVQGSPVSGSQYPSSCTGAVSNNYSFNYVNGNVTVNKKGLTVTADNKSRAYGAANPTLTATFTGFVLGQNLGTSDVTGSPLLSTMATPSSPVAGSPYAITAALGTLASGNYAFTTFTNGILTITQSQLTVTANNQTRVFGAANPALTFQITGFQNGETLATSGVTGTPNISTSATSTSGPGAYPITAAQGTLAAPNYTFATANGTLTVTQAATTTTITNASALGSSTVVGQNYPVNWTTSPVAPGAGTPTGNVTVSDGTGNTCTAAVGAGTCSLASTLGAKTITATYAGDANFGGSTSQAVQHNVVIGLTGNVKQFIAFGTNTNLAGVTMTLLNTATQQATTTTTDANGNYSFGVTQTGGSYTITPSGLGKAFEATSRTYTNVAGNITGGDFIAYDVPGPNAIPRTARVVSQIATQGQPVTVPVLMTTTGVETRVAFTVEYPVTALGIPTVTCGTGAVNCTLAVNNSLQGKVGITITPTAALPAGTRELVKITFPTFQSPATSAQIRFGDFPTQRDVRNAENNPLPMLYWTDGLVSFTGGTLLDGATISGRVTTAAGQGLRNATVTIIDTAGNRRTTVTSSFGAYQFEGLEVGRDYLLTVASKRFRFATRIVNLTENLSDVNLVGLE